MKGEFVSIETARINADIEKENKELQQRIEKAIFYCKEEIYNNYINSFENTQKVAKGVRDDLLKILGGKDE